jgi:beta-lactamase class A
MIRKILFLTLVISLFSTNAFAQRRQRQQPVQPTVSNAAPQTLDEKIKAAIAGFQGNVWIYAKNLDTGKTYNLRGEERVRTASTIKFPIMVETYFQVSEGKIKWTDEFTLTRQNRQGGSGILGEFSEGSKIDLRTAKNLMIVVSDNTATNLILDKITADAVNARMESLGLQNTRSLRKIGGGGDARIADEGVNRLFGIGVSTPLDMVKLLEMLEFGKVISKEASKDMIDTLRRQQYTDGIGRNTLDTIPVASKSGALDRLRSDVGIVYTRRGRIAMAITVDDMPIVHYSMDNAGNEMIWKLSQILQEGLAR